jgi:hypothetical protein
MQLTGSAVIFRIAAHNHATLSKLMEPNVQFKASCNVCETQHPGKVWKDANMQNIVVITGFLITGIYVLHSFICSGVSVQYCTSLEISCKDEYLL